MGFRMLQAALLGLLLALMVQHAAALSMDYCSSLNTASTAANESIYQSDGLCHDFCDGYAYAIVNDKSCWCSDYTPAKSVQVSTSECNTACPGYPDDLCGGDGLYGYMQLGKAAAGTKGGQSSSSEAKTSTSSTKQPTTTSQPPTTSSTPTTSDTPTPTTTTTPSPSHTTAAPETTSESSSAEPTTQSPTTLMVQTVTAGGTVQTVTVTPSAGVPATSDQTVKSKHSGLSTGAAVGVAIGVIAAAAFAAIAAFLIWRRKRKQRETEEALFPAGDSKAPSPRGSSPGASNSGKMTETSSTPAFARHGGGGSWETDQSGRRRSALMPIDPRIDPGFTDIYSRSDNKSRDSINSLRDDHDYSRRVHQPNKVLRATNPDPDDE